MPPRLWNGTEFQENEKDLIMNWFKNRKTVTKLMIGFGRIAAMLAFVAYRGIRLRRGVNTMLNTMYERDLKGLSSIKEANINLIYIGRAFRAAILAGDKAQVERYRGDIDKYTTAVNTLLGETEKTIATDEGEAEICRGESRPRRILPASCRNHAAGCRRATKRRQGK